MKSAHCRHFVAACGIMVMALSVTACNTTKATIDTTVKFFSSTSPDSMFTADGMVAREQKIKLFAGVSYDNLRQEAAAGSGQYVSSLADLYGVPVAKHQEFGRLLQEKHAELFTTDLQEDHSAHLKMVAALDRALLAEPSLIH
ncbi:MAG: DUF3015 family protein [Nitrospira sp.]